MAAAGRCASEERRCLLDWINRLAKKVGLAAQTSRRPCKRPPSKSPPSPPAAPDDEPAIDDAMPSGEPAQAPVEEVRSAPVPAPAPREPVQVAPPERQPVLETETAVANAELEWVYREVLGMDEPKPGRRWRRGHPSFSLRFR